MTVRRLPVSEPLPDDWREQARRRDQEDRDARMVERDRMVAAQCSHLRKDGRHRLVDAEGPTFMCDTSDAHAGCSIFTSLHCNGIAATVPGTKWTNVPCPVFEIDGERWPPREGRVEPKARRKRIIRRTA